jgi:hypothetical protein
MIKQIFRQSKWLVSCSISVVLVVATLLTSGCPAANQLPVISDLAVNSEGDISPGVSYQIECTASDPDGDELTYAWSTDGGYISGVGSTATWTTPDEPGAYTITVIVADDREGIATKQLTLNVLAPNQPPVIESLAAEWVRLKKASNTPVTCIASDPDGDELTYEWSAVDADGSPAGNITGEGSVVTWVAPNDYGKYTFTVTVSDGRGGEATSSVDIIVCSCGSAH